MSNEDTLRALGKLIPEGADAQRDAVHIAVAPVVADEVLQPGDRVAFVAGSHKRVRRFGTTIGIIDPFLSDSVQPGQTCWLYLNPGSITSLRHDWTHPAFPQEHRTYLPAGASASERWIREYAVSIGLDYEDLMYGADEWVRGGEYLVRGGLLEGIGTPDEFWKHYESVREKAVSDEAKRNFFSCSC